MDSQLRPNLDDNFPQKWENYSIYSQTAVSDKEVSFIE